MRKCNAGKVMVTVLLSVLPLGKYALADCSKTGAPPDADTDVEHRKEFVPGWAKEVVWYQVFPERFRDGDPDNNPTLKDIENADPQPLPEHWEVHPWGSDWYKLQPYERANGDEELWKHMLRRRYGGDLRGIIDKLDYIADMGFTAIYLNPVFDSPSLHKYDAASYHHIDPNFGPDPEGDREMMARENPLDPSTWVWTRADELALELIKQAHKRDIRIIFDGVFNHVGVNSFAFKDLKENQQDSAYRNWFTVLSWEDKDAGTAFDYEGWFGVKSLPEFREDEHGLVKGPRDYVFAATERWMNPKGKGVEHGIDGWRLDVAFCIAHPFWKDWRAHVKSINPKAYLTAEIVDTPERVKPYFQGDEFDGEMNYNFAFASAEFFFNPEPIRISASEFDKKLRELRELYPEGVSYVTQNLFGSHDSNRIGSHIVNRGIGNFRDWGRYFNLSNVGNNPDYKVRKPNSKEIRLQKLFVIMQMTYVGAPMVYYGDEVGMWGANDPDSRKPMLWPDIEYEDEATNPDGSKRKPDSVSINRDLQQHYKTLISIRNRYPALRLGDFTTLLTDDERSVYGFERSYQGQRIWILLNNSSAEQNLRIDNPDALKFREVLDDLPVEYKNDEISLVIPAKWGAVLVAE